MSLKLDLPLMLLPPERDADGLWARVTRAQIGVAQPVSLRALDRDGRTLGLSAGSFRPNDPVARIKLDLPVELANRASRIILENGTTAGAVTLLDDGGGRKPIGLVTDNPALSRQPMLGDIYFVERALAPNHEVRADRLQTLLKQELAVIVVTDNATFGEGDREALRKWMERGGMVVRFAGEKLASEPSDDLLPVRVRPGDRTLGGALSWTEPAHLAAFPNSSPFAGLQVPKDVAIERQVLAEPDIDLGAKTWARLTDGTPLVTGERKGDGFSVLFHVGSTADWSNLPISGLFVEMLDRLVMTASGVVTNADENRPLAPARDLERVRPADAADRLRGRDRRQGLADHQGRAAASARLLRSRRPASRAQSGAVAAGVPGARHPGAPAGGRPHPGAGAVHVPDRVPAADRRHADRARPARPAAPARRAAGDHRGGGDRHRAADDAAAVGRAADCPSRRSWRRPRPRTSPSCAPACRRSTPPARPGSTA